MTNTVQVKGIENTLRNLRRITSPAARRRVLSVGAYKAQEFIAEYPKSTIANSPSNSSGRWYECGFGTRTATGKAYRTSETLGRRWTTRVNAETAVVGNNASYVRFVQGDRQARFHARRGWLTVETVATDTRYVRPIIREMDRQIAREITQNS